MMAIFRVNKDKDNPYVVMNKEGLYDDRLSWKAKGILAHLISRPDDWQIYEIELQKHAKDGRQSTKGGLQELIDAGYIERGKRREADGTFGGYEYNVYEVPRTGESHRCRFSDNGETDNGGSNTTNYGSNQVLNKQNNLGYFQENTSCPFNEYIKNHGGLREHEINAINRFISRYKELVCKDHPRLRPETWQEIGESILITYDDSYDMFHDIGDDDLEAMIELYFQKYLAGRYEVDDPTVAHFVNDGIQSVNFYETRMAVL